MENGKWPGGKRSQVEQQTREIKSVCTDLVLLVGVF